MMVAGWADSSASKAKTARHTGPVCAIARAEVFAGRDEEVEFLLNDMALQIKANEKACTSYAVTRLLGTRTHFAIHARFSDWAAFKAHPETPHMERLLARLSPLLAAPVSLEIFLEV
jgi:quinol monooxygenase YgiN